METLSKAKIDVRALTIADTADFGIVRIIAPDPDKAVDALRRSDFTVKTTEVIAFEIPDHFGTLYEAVKTLGEGGVNIEYSYSLAGKNKDRVDIVISVKDNAKAVDALKKAGISLVSISDIV